MTPEENEERARQAANGMHNFMKRLTDAIDLHHAGQKDPEEPWDEHDYEKFFKESDARNDKYGELLDKYGHSDEAHEKIAKEMGWDRNEDDEEARKRIEELNAICEEALNNPEPEPELNPAREGIDWIRSEDGEIHHPLQHRCQESACKFGRQVEKLGLDESGDKDLDDFVFEFHTTGVKLAGALNGFARGEGFCDDAFTVAYLKRTLDHLHKSQAALEAVVPRKLLPETTIADARKELFEIREGILRLMDQFRGRT